MPFIQRDSAGTAWEESIRTLLKERDLLADSDIGGAFYHVHNMVIRITAPLTSPRISAHYAFPDLLKQYNFHDESQSLETALIIERMRRWPARDDTVIDQLNNVITLLRGNLYSRRAVIGLWDPELHRAKTPICPCLFQVIARPSKGLKPLLDATVVVRSGDAWLGAPLDIHAFSDLQAHIASQVNVNVGSYTHHFVSYHLYQQHAPAAMIALGQ